jgi:molecular chaperone DnaK (HSP70)
MPEPRFAIGIDLGTTNCAIAWSSLGDEAGPPAIEPVPQVLHPGEVRAETLLPSFLYLPAEAELAPGALALPWDRSARDAVGAFARSQGASTPARLVSSAKSWLSYAGVDRRAPILPWGAPAEVPKLSPLAASARYLEHLRATWDAAHADAPLSTQDVVLTVPASFDAVARELTVEAAAQAGLPESLRLLEEPQAALYAWLADRSASWRDEVSVGDVILVVDVGGGTTDFSLMAVREERGSLELERIAVGEHILLGGDNMDLALAYAVRGRLEAQGTHLDDWQMRALTHGCRVAKESLLGEAGSEAQPLVIPGRSSRLVGGTLRTETSRAEVESVLLDGFFPEVDASARPQAPRRAGLTALGLPYASDAAVTRHLAAFLGRSSIPRPSGHAFVHPTAILFNGGVTRSPLVRERVRAVVAGWCAAEGAPAPAVLGGADPDLAVSRGAAHYARVRRRGGLRIRGGTAQAYYVGIERGELPVPGVPPPIDALCVAPIGMEEGSEVELAQPLGLIVGEPVSFRFFGSTTRRGDAVGAVAAPTELTELSPIETSFEGEGAGGVVQVKLHARVTEVGTLELSAVDAAADRRWKLSFNVRVE